MEALEEYALNYVKPMTGGEDNAFADFVTDEDIAAFENDFGVESGSEALSDSFDQAQPLI